VTAKCEFDDNEAVEKERISDPMKELLELCEECWRIFYPKVEITNVDKIAG